MIPFVDVIYDGDDYEFEISLEPKDPCCFGFKVVYHNGSFLLLQNIESIDISCVPGMEYIENDEELYDREPFTVEEEKLRKEAVQELLMLQRLQRMQCHLSYLLRI